MQRPTDTASVGTQWGLIVPHVRTVSRVDATPPGASGWGSSSQSAGDFWWYDEVAPPVWATRRVDVYRTGPARVAGDAATATRAVNLRQQFAVAEQLGCTANGEAESVAAAGDDSCRSPCNVADTRRARA